MSKWEVVKLGKLTRIKTGKLDANASSKKGTYPFFTCSKEPLKISTYSYDCECVLVAGNGDLNVKYYKGKFDAYQRTYILESVDKSRLFVPYLYLFLDTYIETLRQQSIGGVIKYIKLGNLTDAELPLPPLDEQKKIANELDKITDIIAKRKTQLEKLDLLVKSRFIEMFGDPVANPKRWTTKGLFEIGTCKNGMNFHIHDTGVEIHCLGVGDFKEISCIDNTEQLSTVSLNEMPTNEYLLRNGDIVFVRSNGNKSLVGRSIAVYPNNIPTTFSGFCIRFRQVGNLALTDYLLRVFKTDSMRKKMTGRGANIQNLNQQILASLIIPVPPRDLQTQFATFVAKVDKLKSSIQQSLTRLETLKRERLQFYFE